MSPSARLLAALLTVTALAGSASAWATGAPSVETMIVGTGGSILAGPRTVTAAASTIRVGARSCAVAAGTPLAALVALRVPYLVRDYGHCGASPRNSGELFVYSLAGEHNRGQDGWEYKVGETSGTTGAGDASGAMGNGQLLRSGQRVLWFWCDAYAGGCQRTLEVSAARSVSPAGRLTVTVRGYENEGRGAPVAGAVVSLGSDFATTGSSGRATLIAPSSAGRYRLTASRRGMVPSFPQAVQVR